MATSPSQSSSGSTKTNKKHVNNGSSSWIPSEYPYATDYNDHFETPLQAYQDTKLLLDWLSANVNDVDASNVCCGDNDATKTTHDRIIIGNGRNKKKRHIHPAESAQSTSEKTTSITLYDPYYCNGRTAVLLRELGYPNIIHEKRDFYADIEKGTVPEYDILITNPPYSDTHKKRCLDYCFEQLRGQQQQPSETSTRGGNPFLLLMPAYTASKQYYRDCLAQQSSSEDDVVYLVPSAPYHYEHPENTGKDKSPFDSLWFCGLGKERVTAFQHYWESLPKTTNRPTLATSLAELQAMNVISLQNRPNPRKRGKKRKQQVMLQQAVRGSSGGEGSGAKDLPLPKPKLKKAADTTKNTSTASSSSKPTGKEMTSKYRDPSGKRTKKRF
jgi:hypothetical protein